MIQSNETKWVARLAGYHGDVAAGIHLGLVLAAEHPDLAHDLLAGMDPSINLAASVLVKKILKNKPYERSEE